MVNNWKNETAFSNQKPDFYQQTLTSVSNQGVALIFRDIQYQQLMNDISKCVVKVDSFQEGWTFRNMRLADLAQAEQFPLKEKTWQ